MTEKQLVRELKKKVKILFDLKSQVSEEVFNEALEATRQEAQTPEMIEAFNDVLNILKKGGL
jgi:hypothetical protein